MGAVISALFSFADSALKYATEKEKNNPLWLKERNRLLDIKRRYDEELNKGEDGWSTFTLDDIRSELLDLVNATGIALAASKGN